MREELMPSIKGVARLSLIAAGDLSEGGSVRCGSFSTELGCARHVRFPPDSDRAADVAGGPVRANRRHRNERGRHRMCPLCIFSSSYTGYGGVASDRPTSASLPAPWADAVRPSEEVHACIHLLGV